MNMSSTNSVNTSRNLVSIAQESSIKNDELHTNSTIAEIIELKFFECETWLRELLSKLVEPAINKAKFAHENTLHN